MNFYLNLLDDFIREEGENPSIGIILCAEKDNFEVEYSLRNINKPVGVSEYYLTKELPEKFKKDLPSPDVLKEKLLEKEKKDPETFEENKTIANQGGTIAGNARKEIEAKTGKKVVQSQNYLGNKKQIKERNKD